jgi:hypothetical protein
MAILRGLSSRVLPCGCLAGVYETYEGVVILILDAKGPQCADSAHVAGNPIPTEPGNPPRAHQTAEDPR